MTELTNKQERELTEFAIECSHDFVGDSRLLNNGGVVVVFATRDAADAKKRELDAKRGMFSPLSYRVVWY